MRTGSHVSDPPCPLQSRGGEGDPSGGIALLVRGDDAEYFLAELRRAVGHRARP